jgi:DNA-directed RNA polymerase sigma subunit (sigma70/sigma32)
MQILETLCFSLPDVQASDSSKTIWNEHKNSYKLLFLLFETMSNLDLFLAKLAKSEPLSYEEEYAMLEAVSNGDMIARQRIAEGRLKHVTSIVWDAGQLSDHILAANAGLLRAIDAFVKNPNKWKSFDECVEEYVNKEITE